jgi:hypothetical protein
MPITLAGSERRRVARDTGAGGVAGSAHGSIERGRVVGRDTGAGGVAGSGSIERGRVVGRDTGAGGVAGSGSIERGRVVGRDTGAGGVAGSAHGSTPVAADGTDRVGVLGCAASLPGAGSAGGVAFARAARAAGLFGSKGGGSVGFRTWSEDGVESAGPTVFAGGDSRSPLCA